MKTAYTLLGLMLASLAMAQTPANQGSDANRGGSSAEETFKKRDANKDNFLSKTEISGSRVADAFDKLDTNKDGRLSLAEYKAGRDALQGRGPGADGKRNDRPKMQGRNIDARFKERDTNGDGFISKTEVSGSRMADRFDAMDTNKDGKLSLDEMKAGMHGKGNMRNGTTNKTT